MPTASEVLAKAKSYADAGTYFGPGMCLRFSRLSASAPALYPTAIEDWRNAKYRHAWTSRPPAGALLAWSGGSREMGHRAVSAGDGYVYSTDILREGRVDRVSLAYLASRWGNLTPAGWSEDIDGVRVAGLVPVTVTVELENLRPGMANEDVRELQVALRAHGMAYLNSAGATGFFGDQTRAMCREFQNRVGWTGADADGIPGPKTCALLGLHVA